MHSTVGIGIDSPPKDIVCRYCTGFSVMISHRYNPNNLVRINYKGEENVMESASLMIYCFHVYFVEMLGLDGVILMEMHTIYNVMIYVSTKLALLLQYGNLYSRIAH
jgi:hypothetical protein